MVVDFNKWKPVKGGEGIAMKAKKVSMRTLILFLILLAMVQPWAFAEDQGGAHKFEQEELDQILAPIALYPDSLLAQVLMAATYPLEVVEADRWVRANKNLKDDHLNDALEKMEWDPSVKALAPFPQVLAMMSEKLDWMQKLGDAFLAQEEDVMDAVQKLRAKAEAAGNLKTTDEQKVVVEEKVIRIEPASPEVVYVPVYNPVVAYGPVVVSCVPPLRLLPPWRRSCSGGRLVVRAESLCRPCLVCLGAMGLAPSYRSCEHQQERDHSACGHPARRHRDEKVAARRSPSKGGRLRG